jgi:hypothetical protein
MARRSYLRRIAEPLTPGLPALFSVPSAAPGEQRPPVAPVAAATPALRRTAARPSAASSAGRAPRASFGGDRRATPNMPPSPTEGEKLFGVPGTAPNGPAITTGIAPPSVIATDLSRPSIDPAGETDAMAPAEPGAVTLPLEPPAAPPAGLEPTSPRIHIGTVEVRTTPQPLPPTPVQPPSPAVPPAASPASGNAAAPLSRAYGWRYGLIQA